jgi:hypothetical protein
MDPIVSNGGPEYHLVEDGTSPYPGSWHPTYRLTAGGSSFGWCRHLTRLDHVGSPLEVALILMLLVWESE